MSAIFVSQGIWPQLTRAARGSRQHCAVAVAYFGKGASRLLPLAKGSRLVVDASERSVASGQTCPADLIKLVKRGVAVYGVPNLHAKVFVLGRNGLYRFCQCLQPLCFATGRGCHSHHRWLSPARFLEAETSPVVNKNHWKLFMQLVKRLPAASLWG